jgi:hypothetical protein
VSGDSWIDDVADLQMEFTEKGKCPCRFPVFIKGKNLLFKFRGSFPFMRYLPSVLIFWFADSSASRKAVLMSLLPATTLSDGAALAAWESNTLFSPDSEKMIHLANKHLMTLFVAIRLFLIAP